MANINFPVPPARPFPAWHRPLHPPHPLSRSCRPSRCPETADQQRQLDQWPASGTSLSCSLWRPQWMIFNTDEFGPRTSWTPWHSGAEWSGMAERSGAEWLQRASWLKAGGAALQSCEKGRGVEMAQQLFKRGLPLCSHSASSHSASISAICPGGCMWGLACGSLIPQTRGW